MAEVRARKGFLLFLLLAITATFLAMIRPFVLSILLAAIFSALASPLYRRVLRAVQGHRGAASVLTILLLVVLVAGPLLTVLAVAATQAARIVSEASPWVESRLERPDLLYDRIRALPGAQYLEPYRGPILRKLAEMIGKLGAFFVGSATTATRNTFMFLLQFFFMAYAMFFFLKGGRRYLMKLRSFIPLEEDETDRLLDRFVSVSRAILKGTLVIALLQGTLAGIGFALAGVPGAVFWGLVMIALSLLPAVGTAVIWIPGVAWLYWEGRTVAASLLLAWCAGVVSTVDNLLRPRLVGRDTNLHQMFVFFGTLGGIMLFGVVGFLLGPIVAALFVTVWEIWGERERVAAAE